MFGRIVGRATKTSSSRADGILSSRQAESLTYFSVVRSTTDIDFVSVAYVHKHDFVMQFKRCESVALVASLTGNNLRFHLLSVEACLDFIHSNFLGVLAYVSHFAPMLFQTNSVLSVAGESETSTWIGTKSTRDKSER